MSVDDLSIFGQQTCQNMSVYISDDIRSDISTDIRSDISTDILSDILSRGGGPAGNTDRKWSPSFCNSISRWRSGREH